MTAAPVRDSELLTMAYEMTANSYVPYSHFPVGAALLLTDGTVVTGCNVENASYGMTMCAERSAVYRMVAELGERVHTGGAGAAEIAACAIVGAHAAPCNPCGACRQVLHEFGCQAIIVESAREQPGVLGAPRRIDFTEVFPHAFGPKDL